MQKWCGFILIFSLAFCGFFFSGLKNPGLAESVLRLHVIANSDRAADQQLKLAVRDELLKYMKQEFIDLEDADQAEELARQHNADIQAVAEQTIRQYGYDYPVEVRVGAYHFPDKTYGKMLFPAGEYDAVRVLIGEAKGKNWWCVLFPPLCLISSSEKGMVLDQPDLPPNSKMKLEDKLTGDQREGRSVEQSKKARITLKCLELLPEGIRLGHQ